MESADLRFLFNPPSFRDSALQLQLQLPFPMPLSSPRRSPSIISTASSTAQAVKKATKTFKKVVKNGAAVISCLFKKHHTSSGSGASAAGALGTCLSLSYLPSPANKFLIVGGGNSTRPTSVIDLDEEVNPLPAEETPEKELSTFWRLNLLSFQALIHLYCRTFAKNLAIPCLWFLQERHQGWYQ